jgi:hypothetical protein
MKKITFTALTLILSASAMTASYANEETISAQYNITSQTQAGMNNMQTMNVASITGDMSANITINADSNNLTQYQQGTNNMQTLNIATVESNTTY